MGRGKIGAQTGGMGRVATQLAPKRRTARGSFKLARRSVAKVRAEQSLAIIRRNFFTGLTFANYKARYDRLPAEVKRGLETPAQVAARKPAPVYTYTRKRKAPVRKKMKVSVSKQFKIGGGSSKSSGASKGYSKSFAKSLAKSRKHVASGGSKYSWKKKKR